MNKTTLTLGIALAAAACGATATAQTIKQSNTQAIRYAVQAATHPDDFKHFETEKM